MSDAEIVRAIGELAGGAYALKKLVGPTLDMLGNRARDLTERAADNAAAVFRNAIGKADLDEEGSIPPRVLKTVFDEAQWAEEQLVVEYLGGVLASGRTALGRDDTAAVWAKKVGGLSTYSIRLHYLLYEAARRVLVGREIAMGKAEVRRRQAGIYVAGLDLVAAMDLAPTEHFESALLQAFTALQEEDLLDENFAYGTKEALLPATKSGWIPYPGLVYFPSPRGMELFLTVCGVKHEMPPSVAFIDPRIDVALDVEVRRLSGVAATDLGQVKEEDRGAFEADLLSRIRSG